MTDVLDIGRSTIANDISLPPQARVILAHLQKGKTITPMESLIVYNIYRLSDCILKIRNAGHDVITEDCKDESGKRYGRYSLNTKLTLQ
jgi:hypothetical protein